MTAALGVSIITPRGTSDCVPAVALELRTHAGAQFAHRAQLGHPEISGNMIRSGPAEAAR